MPTLSKNGKRLGRPPTASAAATVPPLNHRDALKVAKFLARYDAAGMGRRMAGWNPPTSGPNRAIEGLQKIRNRSRDASRNDWAGESSVQKLTTGIVGIAITPRFRRVKNAARKQFITDLWSDFVKQADADCVLDYYGMQTLMVRSWLEAGEVFIRRRPRFPDEDLAVPMQIQLLEAEMVPLLDADAYQGLPAGNIIRSGIELDKRGKRVAYWVFKQHPGDNLFSYNLIDPTELVRVAASDVAHVFEPKRPGQLRGVSVLAPTLAKLRGIGDFEDATLERQKIANLFVAFIKKALPTINPNEIANGLLSGQPLPEVPGIAEALTPLGPGVMQELGEGEEVQFSNPPEAGTTYSDYMRTSHLGSAAAAGLPYELFSGDIANVSDRTLRIIINDSRRFMEQRQWQIVIPMGCQRVIQWFSAAAALAEKVSLEEVDMINRCEHAPHGWQYIHPVQDVQGKALEVLNGFRSRSSVVGERGDDIETVDQERHDDNEREVGLGLAPDPAAMPDPNNPDPAAPTPAPPPKEDPKKAEVDLKIRLAQLAEIEARTDALRAAAARAAEPVQPAPEDPLAAARLRTQEAILAAFTDDEEDLPGVDD